MTVILAASSSPAADRREAAVPPDMVRPVFGLFDALRVVPRLLAEVEKIAASTAALPRMERAISKVAEDASVLPAMYERMAAIEEAMPTLVDVQRRLADLPATMEHLEGEMGGLGETLQRLLASLDQLDAQVATLRDAVEPLARVADRVPSRKRGNGRD